MATFQATDSNSMRHLAELLENGSKSRMSLDEKVDKLCEAQSWTLKYVADVAEHGYVTPGECAALHQQHRDHVIEIVRRSRVSVGVVLAATIPVCLTVLGIVLPIIFKG